MEYNMQTSGGQGHEMIIILSACDQKKQKILSWYLVVSLNLFFHSYENQTAPAEANLPNLNDESNSFQVS